jgi:hypothetical protein
MPCPLKVGGSLAPTTDHRSANQPIRPIRPISLAASGGWQHCLNS